MRQTGFSFLKSYSKEFGGSSLVGKRKGMRPLSTKEPIHLVLKSSHSSFFSPSLRKVEFLVRAECQRFGIKLFNLAPNWNHIHLLIQIPSRAAYNKFIRSLSAQLVRLFSKILNKNLRGLFDLRPFTKIISWGRQFQNAFDYHILNQLEARGLMSRKKPKEKSKKNHSFVQFDALKSV